MTRPAETDDFDRAVLQMLGIGLAVADPATWDILFENAAFFHWFPPPEDNPEAPLERRLAGLKVERARSRLSEGRSFTYDVEAKKGARTISISVRLRTETVGDRSVVIAECHDVTKQIEAEYMLDSYSRMAEKNARELKREKDRVERLLLNIMPKSVYEELKDYGTTTPQRFDAASVLMLDFVGFTDMAIAGDPGAVIAELNDIFSAFDRIVELFDCERIKTIGDCYVAVSGLPEANADHAENVARVALRMRRYLEKRNGSHPTEWRCRIGIGTGPLIGSMVGIQKYVYDIFGPAVNLAARLESRSRPMSITASAATARSLRDNFEMTDLGEVDLKGFGTTRIYSVDAEIS